MTQAPANLTRHDPYKNFKFRVFFDDREVPDVTSVTPFGNQPAHNSPAADDTATTEGLDRDKFEPIMLERAATQDSSFSDWLGLVLPLANRPGGLDDFSEINRDVRIEQLDDSGNVIAAWLARGCRPIEYHQPNKVGGVVSKAPERLFLEYDALERIS